jgi:hypothetical protein
MQFYPRNMCNNGHYTCASKIHRHNMYWLNNDSNSIKHITNHDVETSVVMIAMQLD